MEPSINEIVPNNGSLAIPATIDMPPVDGAQVATTTDLNMSEWLAQLNRNVRFQQGEELNSWASKTAQEVVYALSQLDILQLVLYAPDFSEGQAHLQFIGGYAIPHDLRKRNPIGAGMMGRVYKTKQPLFLQYKDSFRSISRSSLFALRARAVVIYPIIFNDEVLGVAEFGCRNLLTDYHYMLVREAFQVVALNLNTLQSHLHIQKLLEASKNHNNILEGRELELRNKVVELNRAQDELKQLQEALEATNRSLEDKVTQRTAELEKTLVDLRDAQQKLVVSEKMASLGTLIAGVAHEINTPLGAIKGGSANIMEFLPWLLEFSNNTLPLLEDHIRLQIMQLVQHLFNTTEQLSSKEERALKKRTQQAMQEANIEDAHIVADKLLGAGFYGDPLQYLSLLQHPQRKSIMEYFYYQGLLIRNMRNIQLAANKTTRVVMALKSYSHTEKENALVPVNLKDNLDMVLILYHNQLKQGVNVITNYEDVPPIMANPDELSQVWTNIVHNAAQAMNYSGEMKITLTRREHKAIIEINDNGKGIPKDIQEKIFEPFFTTKGKGEGTGLGLDICRKIVEKHHGRIYVKSQPGNTSFFIELPFN